MALAIVSTRLERRRPLLENTKNHFGTNSVTARDRKHFVLRGLEGLVITLFAHSVHVRSTLTSSLTPLQIQRVHTSVFLWQHAANMTESESYNPKTFDIRRQKPSIKLTNQKQ